MVNNYKIKDYWVELEIHKSRRKTFELRVVSTSRILIKAPIGIKNEFIFELLNKKENWLVKQLDILKEREKDIIQPLNYQEGDSILYLGSEYTLSINCMKGSPVYVELEANTLNLTLSNLYEVKYSLENWYKEQCLNIIKERVEYYQSYIHRIPTKIIIKEQKKRWGSCNSKKELRFNWHLIKVPFNVIDYVVVHEMCHLIHMNHSKEFWSLVEELMPNHKEHRKWLKENGYKIIP